MLKGVGIDRVSIARIAAVQAQFGGQFVARLLTPTEQAQRVWEAPTQAAALARRWAIKEAVAKALGTGIGTALSFQDIEITHSPQGAPVCAVRGHGGRVVVSVSDDEGVAVAIAMLED